MGWRQSEASMPEGSAAKQIQTIYENEKTNTISPIE
jgi:hypothetical protein